LERANKTSAAEVVKDDSANGLNFVGQTMRGRWWSLVPASRRKTHTAVEKEDDHPNYSKEIGADCLDVSLYRGGGKKIIRKQELLEEKLEINRR